MASQIMESKSPRYWAETGQALDFQEKIKSFPRLFDSLSRDLTALDAVAETGDWAGKPVTGTTRFTFLDATCDLVVVHLVARVNAPAVCQRCLGLLRLSLEIDERYLLVAQNELVEDERVSNLDYERWDYEGERLRVLDLVDETLVMALPFAVRHAASEVCAVPVAAELYAGKKTKTTRPFAGLKDTLDAGAAALSPARND